MIRPAPRMRRGLTSVAALIALIVVAILCAALLRVAQARRGEVRRLERQLQADWLVDSAKDRAASILERTPDYPGETWSIAAEDLGGRAPATVLIVVKPVPDHPDQRLVQIQADYPSGSSDRSRASRDILMTLPPSPR